MTATAKRRIVLGAEEIDRTIARLAAEIVEPQDAHNGLIIVGVRRGGEALATRIADKVTGILKREVAVGYLNINLYRDDEVSHQLPESQIPVTVTDRTVIIVDDVLYTGRTVRSALDAVTDLGRPAAIRLCVLIDRGLHELPIAADYVGRTVESTPAERVEVDLGTQAAPTDEVYVVADAS